MDFSRVLVLNVPLLVFLLTGISLSQTDSSKQVHSNREKLLVLPFEVRGLSSADASLLSKRFSDGLKESNRFEIILKDSLQGSESASDPRSLAQTGNSQSVQKVVHVNVVRRENHYVLQIRLVKVSDASLLYAERVDFSGEFTSLLSDIIPEQAHKLSKARLDARTPWAQAALLFGMCLGAILWIYRHFKRKDAERGFSSARSSE
jgi:TolB-like protein